MPTPQELLERQYREKMALADAIALLHQPGTKKPAILCRSGV